MTHKQKILALLSDGRPHTHHELYQLGCVAHSRISDLRKDGYQIDHWRDGDLSVYQLVGSLDEATTSKSADPSLPSTSAPSSPIVASSSEPPTGETPGGRGTDEHTDGGPLDLLASGQLQLIGETR